MNPKPYLKFLLLALLAVLLTTCEKPARDNPWDEKASLNPNDWAPQNFQVEDISITEKKLTWTYDDKSIEGFKLDRKKGDERWQVAYQTFDKEIRSWNDTGIVPDPALTYNYRLYTYAGKIMSAEQTISVSAEFPAPSNLQIEKLSDISYKLTWQDNSIGEEGFKIDRKTDNNDWVIAYGIVGENTSVFVDSNVFVGKSSIDLEYRVYAFYQEFESTKTDANTNAALTPPSNLTITQNSITSVTLNWQDNSTGEEGFRIERKQGMGDWEMLTTITGISYTDEAFELNTDVTYRIAAYYGQYASDFVQNSFNSFIPAPANLTITVNSATSVTINWSYNFAGHEGFKIAQKIDNGSWEVQEENLDPNQNSYIDNELDLLQHDYTYRVFAFWGDFQSDYTEGITQYIPSIGEFYKSGIVFYLDGSGGGLVCAETDQSSSAEWGCYGTSIGGTGQGIGNGTANTAAIVAGCSQAGIAARICNDLILNGYSDWFLPSKDELNLMYHNLKLNGIGGFDDSYYWSSSEQSSEVAWRQDFGNGNQNAGGKNFGRRVRAVRSF